MAARHFQAEVRMDDGKIRKFRVATGNAGEEHDEAWHKQFLSTDPDTGQVSKEHMQKMFGVKGIAEVLSVTPVEASAKSAMPPQAQPLTK